MWLLRVVVFVLLLALLVVVALSNDARVDIKLLGWELLQVRLFLVIFGSAMLGFLVGLAFTGIREVQWRVARKRQGRELSELQEEVRKLRAAPVHGMGERAPATKPGDDLPDLY